MELYVHNHGGLHDPKHCRETLQTWSLLQGSSEKWKITICNENRSAQGDKMQRDFNLTCTSDYNISPSQDKNSEVRTFRSFKSFQLDSQNSSAQQSQTCSQQEQQMHNKNGLNAASANQWGMWDKELMFSLTEEHQVKKLRSSVRNTSQDYLGHVLKNLKGQNYGHRHKIQATKDWKIWGNQRICIKVLHSFGNKDTGEVH